MEIVLLKTPIFIESSLKNIEYTYLPFFSLLGNFKNKLIILDNRDDEWSKETITSLAFKNKVLIISNKEEFDETDRIKFLFFDNPTEKNIEQFSSILKSKIGWIVDVDEEFDEKFYSDEYPDLLQYWFPWSKENGFSERKRLFHHYYLHGKKEGRFCNQEKKDIIDEKIKKPLVNLNELVSEIDLDSICFFKNKLECIFLNMTSKEAVEYEIFVDRLVQNTNINFSKDIDFKIIINNSKLIPSLEKIEKLFKSVELINLNLTKEEDIYIAPENEKMYFGENKKEAPPYGTKSGPNLMFLKTMRILKSYNSCLMLETDCFFSKDWLEKIISYVDNANGFLISGSIYDGDIFTRSNSANLNHLNGVALYATGSTLFQFIIDHFEQFLKNHVNIMPNIAYDFGIKIFIDKNIDSFSNHFFWKFINRNYVSNKYIFNYSPPKDSFLDEEKIMKKYNYAILHKKTNKIPSSLSLHQI